MELLEVNHLCKTYGSGETAVHALKDVSFPCRKANMWRSLANPAPQKHPAQPDWWTGYADFRQGAD